jgi:photosystem II stability/assembly factor-like uncharacterized protein
MFQFGSILFFASRIPAHIYRSDDRGSTWTPVYPTPSPQIIRKICTFYLSADTGKSISLIGTEPATIYRLKNTGWLPISYSKGGNIDEVPQIVSVNDKQIYAILSRSGSNFKNGVLRSLDSGRSWETLKSPASLWALDIDKNNPNRIFIGQFGWIDKDYSESAVYMSDNYGDSWKPIGAIQDDMIWDIEYDTANHLLYVAGGTGLYKFLIN